MFLEKVYFSLGFFLFRFFLFFVVIFILFSYFVFLLFLFCFLILFILFLLSFSSFSLFNFSYFSYIVFFLNLFIYLILFWFCFLFDLFGLRETSPAHKKIKFEKYKQNLASLKWNQVSFDYKNLRVQGPKIWSSLFYQIKSFENLESYKVLIKTWNGTSCT